MSEEKRVTISDIAEELGLSTATVSNVIHGKTSKASDETVRRVQEALEKRQYIPNMAGILLALNDSGIIGVVVHRHKKYESHTLEDGFIASSLNFLSAEIEAADKFLMVKTTDSKEKIIKFASMWNLEGLVLIGFCREDYAYLRSHMRIPFVIYDGYLEETRGVCNITIDNLDGGAQVGRLFRRLGHKRALCIADNNICMDNERYMGFKEGFGGRNADFMQVPMTSRERREFYRKNISVLKKYTAIFAVSDFYAVDLMQFLMEQGVKIPEEISVAGFDDMPICRQFYPTLTSVRQDSRLRAKTALEMLRGLKDGGEAPSTVRLPVTLIERSSTAEIHTKR